MSPNNSVFAKPSYKHKPTKSPVAKSRSKSIVKTGSKIVARGNAAPPPKGRQVYSIRLPPELMAHIKTAVGKSHHRQDRYGSSSEWIERAIIEQLNTQLKLDLKYKSAVNGRSRAHGW